MPDIPWPAIRCTTPGGVIKQQPGLPGDGGYLLHAERLSFVHPLTGTEMVLDAAPPPELVSANERET